MPDVTVGFIGLGKMGLPMSRNIMKGGFPLVVANRSQGAVKTLQAEGATPAGTPAGVARQADVVCLCLPLPATVEEVVLGKDGVAAGIRPGGIVVDFSTIGPSTCRAMDAALAEREAGYLDAPVSGGTTGAEAGSLTVMVGGDKARYERALPLLQRVGKKIVYAGPVGAGAVVKLMNQLLVGINLVGVTEALTLGVKAGVDPGLLYETIASATGDSFALRRSVPDLILKGQFDAMFSVDLLHKDLSLGVEVGKENRVRLLLGALAVQVFEEARELGLGDEDIAAVIKPLERLAGVEVRRR
jgi:3-hydroxyisobutyrate dehydrogenase-like beta-hydroxyacid dehydrogenase